MSSCLCLQHDNQFVEYVCLDNKCRQKLHCNKCVKFFGKDHVLMDIRRVQQSLQRLSLNDKIVTSRNFELADQDLVHFVEGNDIKEKQEQYVKSMLQEREEIKQSCLNDIQQSIEQIMKDNQRSLYNLQESLKKCYSRKIDEIISLEQLRNQTFKHKALLLLQNQFKYSEYAELNDSVMKLHSGKYELMYAKQLNKQIFFEIQQKIAAFVKIQNEMINNFCGQFQALFQLQIENSQHQQNNRATQLSKSGMLIKSSNKSNIDSYKVSTQSLNLFKPKNESSFFGPQNKFHSSELTSLNKTVLMPIVQTNKSANINLSGIRPSLPEIKSHAPSNSFTLPSALSPDNNNLSNIYQIKSIGNLDVKSEYYKEVEAPFKTKNYQTQSSKTIKTSSTYNRETRQKNSFQLEDDGNNFMVDKYSSEVSKNKERIKQYSSINPFESRISQQPSSISLLPPATNLNFSISTQHNQSQSLQNIKTPIFNQTFERQIKSVVQINEETFVFGTVDGFMKIMEINNTEKCIYEVESYVAHQKLSKLKKCWEENGEILFFSNGIDEQGQNSIKLWQMKKGVSDIRQLLVLQDLHGKNEIDQVLFLKLERGEEGEQKKIYFATLSTSNKRQVIKLCFAQIDFSSIKRKTRSEIDIAESQPQIQIVQEQTTSCKVEVITEIVEELVNQIKKLSFYDAEENKLYAYSNKQLVQYILDDEMKLSKKLNKIMVQNKVDNIKAIIPLSKCVRNPDDQILLLNQLQGNSLQKLPNYLLLFTHEGIIKIINSSNLSIIKSELDLSSLDKNYSYSSQVKKVIPGRDGNCLLLINNNEDQFQHVLEFNIHNKTLKQQQGYFKDKVTKFQLINQDTFLTIEDYQELSLWQQL
ncbi:hypothetical protein ABPG74_017378 [Tetrahymena malaccensis]